MFAQGRYISLTPQGRNISLIPPRSLHTAHFVVSNRRAHCKYCIRLPTCQPATAKHMTLHRISLQYHITCFALCINHTHLAYDSDVSMELVDGNPPDRTLVRVILFSSQYHQHLDHHRRRYMSAPGFPWAAVAAAACSGNDRWQQFRCHSNALYLLQSMFQNLRRFSMILL